MKICPRCQTANDDDSKFCEQCGFDFSKEITGEPEEARQPEQAVEPEQPTEQKQSVEPVRQPANRPTAAQRQEESAKPQASRVQQGNKKSKIPIIVAGVIGLVVIAGVVLFFLLKPDNNSATSVSSSSTEASTTAVSSSEDDSSKYDDLIADAKQLTIEGKYKESELKLASIPVSDLAKGKFSAVKEAVESLTEQNNKGIQETRDSASESDKAKSEAAANNSGFTGDYAKWANTFTFYYSQDGQKQSSLTITANGGVTQNNYNGTQFFGQAKVEAASGSVLSYETNEMYPSDMPATKQINPNVKITVTWDNSGGTQVYYGYLSYSSRLALTDGNGRGTGVNEVWISY